MCDTVLGYWERAGCQRAGCQRVGCQKVGCQRVGCQRVGCRVVLHVVIVELDQCVTSYHTAVSVARTQRHIARYYEL